MDLRKKPFYLDELAVEWVEKTRDKMSIEEKAGQLFCVNFRNGEDEEIDYVYRILSPGGCMYRPLLTEKAIRFTETVRMRAKVPLLIAANLEKGGNGIVKEGTVLGSPMEVAATDETEMAEKLACVCAEEAKSVGANWAFAPIIDIDANFRNPITNTRTFGSDVERVKRMGTAYVNTLQSFNFAASIKHFPGDGQDERDQHLVTSVNDLTCEEWDAAYGEIYTSCIEAGALTCMVGHILQPAYTRYFNPDIAEEEMLPGSLSKELMTGLLREKLGFEGLIISDATTMAGYTLAMSRKDAVPLSIANGADMFLFARNLQEDYDFMLAGIRSGIISKERLDEAVTRILAVKAALGLHTGEYPISVEQAGKIIGCSQHREWARECSDKAITLVKEEKGVLPLSVEKYPRILFYPIESEGGFSQYRTEAAGGKFVSLMEERGFQIDWFVPSKGSEGQTPPMSDVNVLIELKEIVKKFGEVTALDRVSFQVRRGEIQGLIGENGSGKSTVSSIIFGMTEPTSGSMLLEGKPYKPKSPLDARANHISMIVQEKDTIDMLSIAENIFLGEEASFGKKGFVNTEKMNTAAGTALKNVGLDDLDVTRGIFTLSYETRKIIEIAKALYYQPELIIVDETTTALSKDGREKIHQIMQNLRNQGKAVLFISHDLPELMDTCDCLTVLRDGKLVDTISRKDFDENKIKKSMVGRERAEHLYRTDYEDRLGNTPAMEVKNVTASELRDISLTLYEGEILGIGGLSGCGMHELGKVMAGLLQVTSGQVMESGELLKNVRQAMKKGIGYISKDRDLETLILSENIQENLTISAWNQLKKWKFFIFPKAEKKFSDEQIEGLNIKCSSGRQTVRELSGGNKQKIAFGKLIGNHTKILILDSPTRGVDVGVKTTMYQLVHDLKKQGFAILIISEELPELLGMSDRILIMKDGKIKKEFTRSPELKDTDVIEYML